MDGVWRKSRIDAVAIFTIHIAWVIYVASGICRLREGASANSKTLKGSLHIIPRWVVSERHPVWLIIVESSECLITRTGRDPN